MPSVYDTDASQPKQRRVRSLCTVCGAWRESDPFTIVQSLSEGALPNSPQAEEIAAAKRSEAPFMKRHLESCGTVIWVYEHDPEWNTVDPAKREQ